MKNGLLSAMKIMNEEKTKAEISSWPLSLGGLIEGHPKIYKSLKEKKD